EDELMAETAGAVDVVRVARVDPHAQSVTFVGARFAAPGGPALARNLYPKCQACVVPGHAHIGKRNLLVEVGEAGQAKFRSQLHGRRRAQGVMVETGCRETKEHARRNQAIAHVCMQARLPRAQKAPRLISCRPLAPARTGPWGSRPSWPAGRIRLAIR